jgi:hypothetical protein
VREGINIFLGGFVPTENLRFREESLSFRVNDTGAEGDESSKKFLRYKYPAMAKTQGNFKLHVRREEGEEGGLPGARGLKPRSTHALATPATAAGRGGRVHRQRDHRDAGREWHRQDDLHPHAGRHAQAG